MGAQPLFHVLIAEPRHLAKDHDQTQRPNSSPKETSIDQPTITSKAHITPKAIPCHTHVNNVNVEGPFMSSYSIRAAQRVIFERSSNHTILLNLQTCSIFQLLSNPTNDRMVMFILFHVFSMSFSTWFKKVYGMTFIRSPFQLHLRFHLRGTPESTVMKATEPWALGPQMASRKSAEVEKAWSPW